MNDAGAGRQMSNLQLRIISAVILAVVVLGITWFGGVAFRVMAAAIAGAMYYEWSAMARRSGDSANQLLGAALLAAFLIGVVVGYAAVSLLILLAISVIATAVHARLSGQGQWAAAGLAYAGLSGLSLAYLRGADHSGLVAVLFLFAVVWATDIFAYFVGRSLGGPKLAPAISPGKTQSGALGGTLGGIIVGLAVAVYAGTGNPPLLAAIALALSVISQAGDLFESWVKRRHGVKDSGRLIPGHGGVLDRVDGLVAAALALYLIGWMTGGADNPAQALFAI